MSTPESSIKRMLMERATAVLTSPDVTDVGMTVDVLHKNGVTTAKAKDEHTIYVNADQVMLATDLMDRALNSGMIKNKPHIISPEGIDPDTQPSAETLKPQMEAYNTPPSESEVSAVAAKNFAAGLISRIKKIRKMDESVSLQETLSKSQRRSDKYLMTTATNNSTKPAPLHFQGVNDGGNKNFSNYVVGMFDGKPHMSKPMFSKIKAQREHDRLMSTGKFTDGKVVTSKTAENFMKKHLGEDFQLDEISYSLMKNYENKAREDNSHRDTLDKKMARRKAGLAMAKSKKITMVKKVAFGEAFLGNILTRAKEIALTEARLVATHKSDCGNHCAKVYKGSNGDDHVVKFSSNGKHNPNADYETNDMDDAHGTAKAELKRMSQFKEAFDMALAEDREGTLALVKESYDQLDEISKTVLNRYTQNKTKSTSNIGSTAAKSAAKMTNEEEINEISREGLNNYLRAAGKDVDRRLDDAKSADLDDPRYDKIYDRERHMDTARDKRDGHFADYKLKGVQGLYTFNHYEHPDGSFAQRRIDGRGPWIHQDAEGNRTEHDTHNDLLDHVNAYHNAKANRGMATESRKIFEDIIKRRGRPKKKRTLDGKIADDDDQR